MDARQAEGLQWVLGELGRSLDAVLIFDVPDDELVRRLSDRTVCQACQTPYMGREPGTPCGELLFTGEAVPAEAAAHLGLANRVVPADDLDNAVASLASQIARNAPLSVRAMKAFVQRAISFRRSSPRDDLEELHRQVRTGHDLVEGLAARREKRPPKFQGR